MNESYQIENYRNSPYFKIKNFVLNNCEQYFNSFEDSLSEGQYTSKLWLIDELKKIKISQPSHIEIIGGWFGYPLIEMLETIIEIKQIDFYELDETCKKVLAQYISHFNPKFKIAMFDDYFERNEVRRRQLIINTSSEHMEDIVKMKKYYKNYPEYPILVVQSNNYFKLEEHINCVNDEEELVRKNSIKNIFYVGKNKLPLYNRFMVIGRW
jgi:hypothetical protein